MEICDANRLNMLSFYGAELPAGLTEAAFRRTPATAACPPTNCNYYNSDYHGPIFYPFDRGGFQSASQNSYPYGYYPIDISSAALTVERASRLAMQSYQQQQPDYNYHHQQHLQTQQQHQQLESCARSTSSQLPLSFALLTNDAEKLFSKTATNADLPLRPILSNPTSPEVHWDINDQTLPKVQDFDTFELWPDGHCRMAYSKSSCDSVRRHASGWAMRNTNNHNSQILKKSCLGVLLCTTSGCPVALRPAICDKARRSQEGRPCSRANCGGTVYLRGCRGHGGYPVTHFWRESGGTVYFQAKGHHDHARPDLKPVRRSKTLAGGKKRAPERTRPVFKSPISQATTALPTANLEFNFKRCPLMPSLEAARTFSGYRTSVSLPMSRACLQDAPDTQNLDAFGSDSRCMPQMRSDLPYGGPVRATDSSSKTPTSPNLNLTNPGFVSHQQQPSLVSSGLSYTNSYPNHFNQSLQAATTCIHPSRSGLPYVPVNNRLAATAIDLAPLKRECDPMNTTDEDSLLQGEDKSPLCSQPPGCDGLTDKQNWLATPTGFFLSCYHQGGGGGGGESVSTGSGEKNASWSTPSPPTGGSSMLFNVTGGGVGGGGGGPNDEPVVRKQESDAHRGTDYDVSWATTASAVTATAMGISSDCQWPPSHLASGMMNHMSSMQSSTPMSADFIQGGRGHADSTFVPAVPFCLESSGSRISQGSSSGSGKMLQQ